MIGRVAADRSLSDWFPARLHEEQRKDSAAQGQRNAKKAQPDKKGGKNIGARGNNNPDKKREHRADRSFADLSPSRKGKRTALSERLLIRYADGVIPLGSGRLPRVN